MLKKLLTAVLLITCLSSASVMSQSVLYMNQILDPIPGKLVEFENGVKAHNAKYHASGENKANLFSIMTGPRSGQYAWVQGPMTYATLDKVLTKEHTADWEKNVATFCKNGGQMRIVKLDAGLTYNPDPNAVVENYIARIFYGVTDVGQLLDAMGMIKKIYDVNKYPSARAVYTAEFRDKDEEAVALVYPFKSWTEFEKTKGLAIEDMSKEMEKVHGEYGLKNFQDMIAASSSGWYDEVRMMVK